jgi:hypothetical protein
MRGKHGSPDWHQYSWMYPITEKCGHTDVNCPWDCPVYVQRGGRMDYARGDCPVADDLYDRVITISLNQWYSARDCRNIATALNKVLSAYCTEDENGRGAWVWTWVRLNTFTLGVNGRAAPSPLTPSPGGREQAGRIGDTFARTTRRACGTVMSVMAQPGITTVNADERMEWASAEQSVGPSV